MGDYVEMMNNDFPMKIVKIDKAWTPDKNNIS